MVIGTASTIVSGMVAIGMAWWGYGIWALAMQALSGTLVGTILFWILNPWRPAWIFSLDSARRLFAFGGYLLAAGLMDTAYNRGYTLLIGKFYGVSDLGYFSRADSAKQLPVAVLTGILSRVAFPVFSAAAHDKVKLRRGVQLALRGMMLINVPTMLGLAAVAEPFVLTLFGEQWLPAVPILQVLCFAGIFWPLHVINLNVLKAQGYSRLFFKLEIIKKVIGVILLITGTLYGVMGVAWSLVISSGIAFVINAYYTGIHLNYGVRQQLRDFLPCFWIALVMGAAVVSLNRGWQTSPAVELVLTIVLGIALFLSLGRITRLSALRDSITLFKQGQ